jgi:hypothetical protein
MASLLVRLGLAWLSTACDFAFGLYLSLNWLLAFLGLGFGFIFRFDLASELDFGLTWHFGWTGFAWIRLALRLARLLNGLLPRFMGDRFLYFMSVYTLEGAK